MKDVMLGLTLTMSVMMSPLAFACADHSGNKMECANAGQSIAATSDGGIVVLRGNTVTKFDKNLKLVKEVELSSKCPVGKPKKDGVKADKPHKH
jgi:hypothetical protein